MSFQPQLNVEVAVVVVVVIGVDFSGELRFDQVSVHDGANILRQLPDWNLLGGKGNCMHVMLCRLLHKCGRPVFMHRLRGGQIREPDWLECLHLVRRGEVLR